MIKSCQNKLVAMATRTTRTLYTLSRHRQLHLPLPWPAARSCGPRAL
jgi:hypothetical protein